MTGFNSKRMMARDVEPLNEQIRGLAEQAGFVMWGDESYNSDDVIDWSSSYDNELKKFAELIVKDCLAQVDKVDTMLDDDKEKTGVAWVGLAIAKHFGVEE